MIPGNQYLINYMSTWILIFIRFQYMTFNSNSKVLFYEINLLFCNEKIEFLKFLKIKIAFIPIREDQWNTKCFFIVLFRSPLENQKNTKGFKSHNIFCAPLEDQRNAKSFIFSKFIEKLNFHFEKDILLLK